MQCLHEIRQFLENYRHDSDSYVCDVLSEALSKLLLSLCYLAMSALFKTNLLRAVAFNRFCSHTLECKFS
jgi:hypothetical protein